MKRIALIPVLALTFGLAAAAMAAGPAADGKALYTAKCQSCHGADGSKTAMSRPVKGMTADAAQAALEGYKAKTYGGKKKATMENLSARLSDADIKALAAYIAKL